MARHRSHAWFSVALAVTMCASGCTGDTADDVERIDPSTPSTSSSPPAATEHVIDIPDVSEVASASPGARKDARFDMRSALLGVDADRATVELETAGWIVRTVSEDGVGNTVRMDERGDRANLTIEDGLVVDVRLF